MSNTKLNCCKCGKESELGDRVYSDGVLWKCEDCARKQIKDLKIADLEAKLAESEKERRKAYQDGFFQKQFEKDVEIIQLKQQLAEKEKEIERLREVNLDIPIKQMQFHHNQDKISFCIEQLEKVKELCIKDMTICEDYFAIEKILDNQIKQIMEMK